MKFSTKKTKNGHKIVSIQKADSGWFTFIVEFYGKTYARLANPNGEAYGQLKRAPAHDLAPVEPHKYRRYLVFGKDKASDKVYDSYMDAYNNTSSEFPYIKEVEFEFEPDDVI